MPIADRASEAAAVKRRLADGGTLLVVGGRSTNFPQSLRTHPRVHFWDSTDPKIETREMPDNVRVVICTRFISHAVFSRVQRYATSRHSLMLPGLNSTGEIKDVLAMALDIPDAMPTPEPTPPTLPLPIAEPPEQTPPDDEPPPQIRHQGGNYRAFLREHADLNASPSVETARLMPALQAAGFSPTEGAVKQMLYILRRERDGLATTVRSKPSPAPRAASAPAALPPPSNIAEALRLIDEVAMGLGLVREAVLKVQGDDERMKATMAALRGFLSNPPPANGNGVSAHG